MAVKTFYLLNTTATAPFWGGSMQDGGSAPAAALSAFGWTVAKSAVAFWNPRIGATARTTEAQSSSWIAADATLFTGSGSGATTAADSFRSATAYTGAFAAGNWTFNFGMRTGAATNAGRIRFQLWAGANADGTSARKIGTLQTCSTITLNATNTTFNSTVTYNPGVITLANEYLFVQVEWERTATGTSNSCTAQFYQSAGSIVTTDFAVALNDAWSIGDRTTNFVLSNGDKTATVTTTHDATVRSTTGHVSGKHYAEFAIDVRSGGAQRVGIKLSSAPLTSGTANSFLVAESGAITINGSIFENIGVFVSGDRINVAWDAGAGLRMV